LRNLLASNDVQFVGLGSGEPQYNALLTSLGNDFPGKVRANVGYNAAIAQRIYAGSDLFLMPSHYEPCGTSQMFSMRYGSLPLVRETGGLADTVENYDDGAADRGTGFVFQWETPDALLGTMQWAMRTYYERKTAWRRMQDRAMRIDFSWNKGAREYIEHYEEAIARHRVNV
jgi:starch synthase